VLQLRRIGTGFSQQRYGFIPWWLTWDSWWTKWHRGRSFYEFFGFPLLS
jgi:hypothetical protein